MQRSNSRLGWLAFGALAFLIGLYLVFLIQRAGHSLLALGALGVLGVTTWVFTSERAYAWRYLYPGVAAVLVFVLFPALYTVGIGFTNYSSTNLLSYERATAYFLDQKYAGSGEPLNLSLYPADKRFIVHVENEAGQGWQTAPLALDDAGARTVALQPAARPPAGDKAPMKDVIAHQAALKTLALILPGSKDEYRLSGLSKVAAMAPLFARNADGSLTNRQDGSVLKPDFNTGFYTSAGGERIAPGFKVGIGLGNFERLFTSHEFQGPLIKIFVWTVLFAFLTVVFTFVVGFVLASLLNWEGLRFRGVYRILLFLPYAVPGFISILIFRGLFNENFGEINLVLNGLFGIKPSWFSDPLLAKTMLLLVNTWLGYPYTMLLCMGMIKAIPADLYEVSAINGGGMWTNLTRITLPLIMKPMMPLLIASFAFNFNNFVLISLLTGGLPDFTDSMVPAGATDILVSYTYRIAFQDSGQNFGLAAAISTVIFALVAVLSVVNLKLTRVNASAR
ncbi:maltose ABC transporter permease MalF [Jeongeupia chitinilytica]|uniref:Maltose/maltodextrin transport system permease protein n=1 Tax=Jeongeupia chitinilytica TaxID=1041641 RepID=A0ABQ3H1T8_9NEIS|nr:maltose ABC transporter permease MalF [Jeongeupia chitinilytica]GHD64369.1 maltose ABC transporter permease MalF [Jeongeupia chitinilytica]